MSPFSPPVALASLSGEADAAWAREASALVGGAFLGGVAIDEPTRAAAREMVEHRDREEFLPPDPIAFVDDQLRALEGSPVRPGINVRAASLAPLARIGAVCRERGAIVEVNAHCRQAEMCAAGAGESLMAAPDRLREQVDTAASAGATVSVKLRAEVPGVDLPSLAATLEDAGADILHVDAMDSESIIAPIADRTDAAVVANNGVRDGPTVREYLEYGADAVSVGRPSDDHDVLARVCEAALEWFGGGQDRADQQPLEGGR